LARGRPPNKRGPQTPEEKIKVLAKLKEGKVAYHEAVLRGDVQPPKNSKRINIIKTISESLKKQNDEGKTYLENFMGIFFANAMIPNTPSYMLLADRLVQKDLVDKLDTFVNSKRSEDIDFMQYRVVKRCFDKQREYVTTWAPRSYAMCGRRAGKTEGNRLKAIVVSFPSNRRTLIIGLTVETCLKLYYDPIIELAELFGLKIAEKRRVDGIITFTNGSEIHFRGNSNADEREKMRGFNWDLVVIDEAQSQKALPYLVEEIISPTLLDRKGMLCMTGTGPRVRGTYWEHAWTDDRIASRYQWNLTHNPTIPDREAALERIKAEKNLTDKSPLFMREYLGMIAYDDDALVYRLADENFFTESELAAYLARVPPTDIRLTGGLDFGHVDADAFAVILHVEGRPEEFLIGEYKKKREGTAELADAVKAEMARIKALPYLSQAHEAWRQFAIYADSAGQKTMYDLSTTYGIPTQNAYKHDKALGVELLQDKVKRRVFRVKRGGIFEDEALKTVFSRNENDELTREVDDDTYHPDLLDATLYAERSIDLFMRR
jgi:hypothetical protein